MVSYLYNSCFIIHNNILLLVNLILYFILNIYYAYNKNNSMHQFSVCILIFMNIKCMVDNVNSVYVLLKHSHILEFYS